MMSQDSSRGKRIPDIVISAVTEQACHECRLDAHLLGSFEISFGGPGDQVPAVCFELCFEAHNRGSDPVVLLPELLKFYPDAHEADTRCLGCHQGSVDDGERRIPPVETRRYRINYTLDRDSRNVDYVLQMGYGDVDGRKYIQKHVIGTRNQLQDPEQVEVEFVLRDDTVPLE